LDNFLVFDSEKVSRFGQPESSAKIQNIPERCIKKGWDFVQKKVNDAPLVDGRFRSLHTFHG